ncbi:MAG: GHKL domain-containing protein [Eubacteriales bacterium]|nr:GHKL domain-containing protein [Eubacteriales bacterium]
MLRNEYLEALENLQRTNPELYKILHNHSNEIKKEMSCAAHTILNMISFINCSYQYISQAYPETKNFEYWEDIQTTLSQLIDYANRTSSYRYSFYEPELKETDLNQLLHSLPESLEGSVNNAYSLKYKLSGRQWNYSLDARIKNIVTDKYQLKSALLELMRNGVEDIPAASPINISSELLDNSLAISVSYISNDNNSIMENTKEQLIQPFFTTKADHAGLGLSIVNNICQKLRGNFSMTFQNKMIINTIELPLN